MLVLATTQGIALFESSAIKSPYSLEFTLETLSDSSKAVTWAQDNSAIYIASLTQIQRYDLSTRSFSTIYTLPTSEKLTNVVVKDLSTLIYYSANKVHLLECGTANDTKVFQTLETHKSAITSLSLSNDRTLLASTSSNGVHVHNLTTAAHTVLRGLPQNGEATTCVFHPHTRTRLLVGKGPQVLIYDTTKPSSPLKTITLGDTLGNVIAFGCSPFSKSLVAIATSNGHMALLDLDKEKALFKTTNVKTPLTSIAFSAEGAAIFLGTESGKLLVLDLRGLGKPPKSISIGEGSCKIEAMSVQKKVKAVDVVDSAGKSSTKPSITTTKPSKPTAPPAKDGKRGAIATTRATDTAKASPTTTRTKPLSVRPDNTNVPPKTDKMKPPTRAVKKAPASPAQEPVVSPNEKMSDLSVDIGSLVNGGKISAASKLSAGGRKVSGSSEETISARGRTNGRNAAAAPITISATRRKTSLTSQLSSPVSARSKSRSPIRPISSGSSGSRASDKPLSWLPSPQLPAIEEPTTPIATKTMMTGNLDTPEIDGWIKAGENSSKKDRKGKGKSVGFQDQADSDDDDCGDSGSESATSEADDREHMEGGTRTANKENEFEFIARERIRARENGMQLSPRRPPPSQQTASIPPIPSPLRSGLGASGSAHDLLKSIVRDVMFDYQRETKAELRGFHLDLIRAGRGWRKDIKEVMEEYIHELKELKEENKRLREENDMLRRGY